MTTFRDASATVSYVAICLCLNALHTGGSLQDQYIGCYQDTASQSNWTNGITDSSTLSIELCVKTCIEKRSTYAILQNGRKCFCGDVLDVSSSDGACDTRCSGNGRQVCGGSNGAMYSSVVYSVCPIGFYGAGCNQTCHCKQQTPCSRISGICPNGCEDSWTLANCSKETCQSLSDRRIGCYRDAEDRAMKYMTSFPSTCTIELCSSVCVSNNYTYSGTQVGSECYCGESYNRYGPIQDSECGSKCDGDLNELCGGGWALSVHYACPIGYFGNACASRCHCKSEQPCTCSSGCKSGWMGSRCEFRNCADSNGDCSTNETCATLDLKFASVNRCICKQGYQKKRLWDPCTDTDECNLGTHKCENLTTTCNNTVGGYFCDCRPGHYRVNATLCHGIPTTSPTGLPSSLDKSQCEQVYSVGVVIGAAIGSAVGSTAIFATILVVVVLCRRRQGQQMKKSEVGTENRPKEVTDAIAEQPISLFTYETLNKMPKEYDSSYTELTGNDHQPETAETRKRIETRTRQQLPVNVIGRDTNHLYEDVG